MTEIPSPPPRPTLAPRPEPSRRRLFMLFVAALVCGVSLRVAALSPCLPALLGLQLRAIEIDDVPQELPSSVPATIVSASRDLGRYYIRTYDPDTASARSFYLRRQP